MKALLAAILRQYRLDPEGFHGESHWARVLENGLWLAARTAANVDVVRLFAYFHDACRENEGIDADHGRRGAALAVRMRGEYFDLPDTDFALLVDACARHTAGPTTGDPTLLACWDADRLDLGRVGIVPDPDYLCTALAKKEHGHIRFHHDRDITQALLILHGEENPDA